MTPAIQETPMSPWLEAVLAKYGWIVVGLTFGFAAKYALLIKRGVPVKARLVFADILLLPMVALIAYSLAARAGITAESAALFASLCTVGADRLVKLLTDRFLQRVDSEVRAVADEIVGNARNAVTTAQAGERLVDDTLKGTAPTEYAALKQHPKGPKT
jgi:hypothetical protein